MCIAGKCSLNSFTWSETVCESFKGANVSSSLTSSVTRRTYTRISQH